MSDQASDNPGARAERTSGRGFWRALGTSGSASGTSGFWRVLPAVMALASLAAFINVGTLLDDARHRGAPLPLWLPVTLEGTSALSIVLCSAIALAIVRLAPPGRRPLWRGAAIWVAGSLVFSLAHVALMTLIRFAAFAAQGHAYVWRPAELPYEYRKDLLAYVIMLALFWATGRRNAAAAPTSEAPTQPAPTHFDIRDGAALVRAPVAEILAARAAGNYVEFWLADGRRPLMRAPLAQVEAELAAAGFVRTHRSWLVNAARVRGLAPAGSGDFRIDLGDGLTAPLSRRYPAALATLRDG